MKIIGIGRNYAAHIKELKNETPEEPIIFLKPDTALLKNNAPFYFPTFSTQIHFEVELVIKICKEGKNVEEKFAQKYFDEIGLGIDFTARDLQDFAKQKGLPWALAKGFNGSAPVSDFIKISEFPNLHDIDFELQVNGETRQKGNSGNMIHNFNKIISYVSQFITIKKGDLIFTGTPEGVGEVKIDDVLVGFIAGRKLLNFEVR